MELNKKIVMDMCSDRKCPERTVHFGKTERLKMAEEQLSLSIVEINEIIKLTNDFIKTYGLEVYSGNNIIKAEQNPELTEDFLKNFNKKVTKKYKGLKSKKDIIWMKFTKCKRLGVVACSNDINFDIPKSKEEYHEPKKIVDGKIKQWKYNTSGIIVDSQGLEWDKSFVLVFPLIGLKEGREGTKQRHELETGIGNYLIENKVPIVDYYSHRI